MLASLLALLTMAPLAATAPVAKSSATPVEWKKIEAAARSYVRELKDHQPRDIVSRSDMAPLFERLARIGWTVKDKDQLLARLPADDEFLVTTLRTKAGRGFMRGISKHAGAYDRLDRLSRMQRGHRRVQDLIGTEGGDKVVEFLATTDDGREIGKRLSSAPRAAGFNAPTGRIYTAEDFLVALKSSYQNEQQARQ